MKSDTCYPSYYLLSVEFVSSALTQKGIIILIFSPRKKSFSLLSHSIIYSHSISSPLYISPVSFILSLTERKKSTPPICVRVLNLHPVKSIDRAPGIRETEEKKSNGHRFWSFFLVSKGKLSQILLLVLQKKGVTWKVWLHHIPSLIFSIFARRSTQIYMPVIV